MKIRIGNGGNRWAPGGIEIDPTEARDLGLRFEVGVAEAVLLGAPDDEDALTVLGFAYTRAGLHDRALEMDLRLAELRPEDPICRYNLACSHTQLGRFDEAFRALDDAVARGYRDFAHLARDPDLRSLRADRRYQGWLNTHRRALLKLRVAHRRRANTARRKPAP